MKKSWLRSKIGAKGLSRESGTPQAKAEARLDRAFSAMIRERDTDKPCIACGNPHKVYEAGHYRGRGMMSTRWNYMNVNAEGLECNRTHFKMYEVKDMDLYRVNLDRRWGRGTAQKLYRLSQKTRSFDVKVLDQLTDAAKRGFPLFKALYDEIG